MDIKNNYDSKDEERQAEQRRTQSRQDAERRHKAEPMRTFEAKLSEKAAHESTLKESQAKMLNDQKKDRKDQESLLNKILNASNKEAKEKIDHSRVQDLEQLYEQENESDEARLEQEMALSEENDSAEDKKANKQVDKKSSEYSEDGHRRVAEKDGDDGQSYGGMGGGTGGFDQDSGSGSFSSQSDSGSQSEKRFADQAALKDLMVKNKVVGLSGLGTQERGFSNNAREFTIENLDDIVDKVNLGFNEHGEEFFSIELNDEYFSGLQVQSVRTDEGIVVKFVCPDVQVRSTFIKYRPMLYAHFKTKSISVFRIDVV